MVTKSGAKVDFDFNVMVPAPVVSSMSCEYAPAGSEAVLYGDYFVDDPNVPLTISMPGILLWKESRLRVSRNGNQIYSTCGSDARKYSCEVDLRNRTICFPV